MIRLLLVLAIGILIGYQYGWSDAQVNIKPVAERIADRFTNGARTAVANDPDRQLGALEK